jgi:hypothetical protein
MRAAVPILIAILTLVSACKRDEGPSAVKQAYDANADQIENQADQQPNPIAKKIYESRADAVRDEGEERKAGLEKAGTNKAPPMPTPPGT